MFIGIKDVERSIADGDSRLRKELERCESIEVDTLRELRTWGSFCDKSSADAGEIAPTQTKSVAAPAPHFTAGHTSFERIKEPITVRDPRVGRNDPCPCGSGKKFKKCCGARS